VVWCLIRLFEQVFGYLPQGYSQYRYEENDMSAVTFNSVASQSSVNQGFLANPSGALTRRGRLARTVVVLSLSVVMAAGFAARSGAGDQVVAATSYTTVVVPAGATLWSVASAYSDGDIQGMVEAIREANNLPGYDVAAGARLKVPTS
jgi:LysM repeat protein